MAASVLVGLARAHIDASLPALPEILRRQRADALQDAETLSASVPLVTTLAQVTGAGDVFVAAHIHAEINGLSRMDALLAGVQAAADHVAGK